MESQAFHICPFCQAASPAARPRCIRCHRSLVGLPLTVYGSQLDAALARPAAPLEDLPLRDAAPEPKASEPALPHAERSRPVARGSDRRAPRPPADRRRMGTRAKVAIGATMMGTVLVGGFLVRAHERNDMRVDDPTPAPAGAASPAAADPFRALPSAEPPSWPVDSPSPVAPPPTRAATSVRTRPARPATILRAGTPSIRAPAAPPTTTSARRPPASPAAAPGAEILTARPDVRGIPVDVERATDDFRVPPDEGEDDSYDPVEVAAVRADLRRAEAERARLAARVDELRARANLRVITDIEEYQRVQAALAAALDQLDEMDAEVDRLRRALPE
jgi:hypothetical protein